MRLERRAEDAPDTIRKRLRNARDEIAQWGLYDYLIVNDDLGRAFSGVQAILAAERMKRDRLVGAKAFLDTLLGAPET